MFNPKIEAINNPVASSPTSETATPHPDTTALPPMGQALLQLQHQFGNRYVQQVLASSPATPISGTLPVQTKLVLGPIGDKYEQEADRIAHEVTFRGGQTSTPTATPQLFLQRQGEGTDSAVTPEIEATIRQAQGSGQPLPEPVKTSMGQALGSDFGRVRVHTDTRADSLNHALQARAFTTGQDIFFRRGEYRPASRSGQSLLAHELAHVVQQNSSELIHARLQRVPKRKVVEDKDIKKLGYYENKTWVEGEFKPGKGPLFLKTPSLENIKQGGLGDCYLLAAVAAIVSQNPTLIEDMIKEIPGKNEVEVRFYDDEEDYKEFWVRIQKTTVQSFVNGQWIDTYAEGALWVKLLEKAYLVSGLREGGYDSKTNYEYIDLEKGEGYRALQHLTGKEAKQTTIKPHHEKGSRGKGIYSEIQKNLFASICTGLDNNSYVVVGSQEKSPRPQTTKKAKSGEWIDKGLLGPHTYAVIGYWNGGIKQGKWVKETQEEAQPKDIPDPQLNYIQLYNPWGRYTRSYVNSENWHQKTMLRNAPVYEDSQQPLVRNNNHYVTEKEAIREFTGEKAQMPDTGEERDRFWSKQYSEFYWVPSQFVKDNKPVDAGKNKLRSIDINDGNGTFWLELTDLTKRFETLGHIPSPELAGRQSKPTPNLSPVILSDPNKVDSPTEATQEPLSTKVNIRQPDQEPTRPARRSIWSRFLRFFRRR